MSSKLCTKQYNKNFVLPLIVVPQLGGGQRHNYSTKTRQAGQANQQSMYSLMSMVYILTLTCKLGQNANPALFAFFDEMVQLHKQEKESKLTQKFPFCSIIIIIIIWLSGSQAEAQNKESLKRLYSICCYYNINQLYYY